MVGHVEHLADDVGGQQGDGDVDEIVANEDSGQQHLGVLPQLQHKLALRVGHRFQAVDICWL